MRTTPNSVLARQMAEDSDWKASEEYMEKVAELMKERATFTSELLDENYFFITEDFDQKTFRKNGKKILQTK